MNYNYRLTIHVENAKKTRIETGKHVYQHKGKIYKEDTPGETPRNAKRIKESKEKIWTTLSFYCKSKKECIAKLNSLRLDHTIAKGKDYKNKKKYNKELYNISFIN
jgi:hypothetical protein